MLFCSFPDSSPSAPGAYTPGKARPQGKLLALHHFLYDSCFSFHHHVLLFLTFISTIRHANWFGARDDDDDGHLLPFPPCRSQMLVEPNGAASAISVPTSMKTRVGIHLGPCEIGQVLGFSQMVSGMRRGWRF
ncbi:hypothetical protein ACLOJK_013575 [Asimina triloba]